MPCGRTGGAGEYGPAYYRVMGHEDFYITNTRPLPIEGVMDRDIDAPARFLR